MWNHFHEIFPWNRFHGKSSAICSFLKCSIYVFLINFSALYYNNGGTSFNSSGRSSNCDEDDMQSNISLEEDVNDLNQKVGKE